MAYMKDEHLRRMTAEQLKDELGEIFSARALLDQNRRLKLIKIKAIENRMEESDPFGPDYVRLEKKWRELDDELDQMSLDDLEYRHNICSIDRELSRRGSSSLRDTRGW